MASSSDKTASGSLMLFANACMMSPFKTASSELFRPCRRLAVGLPPAGAFAEARLLPLAAVPEVVADRGGRDPVRQLRSCSCAIRVARMT